MSLEEIKAWRTREAEAGRPSSYQEFCRVHGFCLTCLGEGLVHNDDGVGFKVVGQLWRYMPDLISPMLEKAAEAERLGDLDTALQMWLEISSKTQRSEAHIQLGRLALALRKWQMAETALLRAVETGINVSVSEAMLGALFFNRSDGARTSNLETAKIWFLRSTATAKIAPTLSLLGMVYSNLKEKENAEKAWRSAIEVDENYEEAYFNLGLLLSADGQAIEAEALLRKAVQLDPGSHRAHRALGILLKELGHYSEAEAELKRILELNPNDSIARNHLRRLVDDRP